MTDEELLLAITNAIKPVRDDIQGMKSEIQRMENDIQGMKSDIQRMESEIQGMKSKIQGMENDIHEIKGRVTKIEIVLENKINPGLQNIEANYTSTFDRYKNSVDDYETMKQDISILKKVVFGHSEKLQRIG